eukprot:GHVS01025774.1.p1 GENE.GHVS01025774.1~~GHVS01025774.1.p1  ORF type:complete len:553 (+),score=40.24 GHVS01025774.1:960-2618(+)
MRSFPSFVHCAKPHPLPRRTANVLLGVMSPSTKNKRKRVVELVGEELVKELKPFQVKGIEYGLGRNGRVLIGDEMGLGKTLQALAIASYYSDEWPLLVVSPSSIRFQWRDQSIRWLPHLVQESRVCIVKNGRSKVPEDAQIVIISYELLAKNVNFQRVYKVIICDESHYLKNGGAKRTQVICPMLKKARRAILLSGTPALNKPAELYHQLSALLPDFCASYDDFAGRYCEHEMNRFSHRMEYMGHKHAGELYAFLKTAVMIRRLKKDVQKELPPKLRSRIPIEIPERDLKELKAKMSSFGFDKDQASKPDDVPQNVITEMFTLTGRAKRKGSCDYISYLIQSECKFLVFGHHREMLDALEEQTMHEKVQYIRIDGATAQDKREGLVKRFQNEPSCQVAILSITACGHGLNLTSAGTVVFTELYWVPGQMIQAEDRCHRIGTTHTTIDVHYLIAEETLDDMVWKTLNRKWSAMTSTLNGLAEALDVNNVAVGSSTYKASPLANAQTSWLIPPDGPKEPHIDPSVLAGETAQHGQTSHVPPDENVGWETLLQQL